MYNSQFLQSGGFYTFTYGFECPLTDGFVEQVSVGYKKLLRTDQVKLMPQHIVDKHMYCSKDIYMSMMGNTETAQFLPDHFTKGTGMIAATLLNTFTDSAFSELLQIAESHARDLLLIEKQSESELEVLPDFVQRQNATAHASFL